MSLESDNQELRFDDDSPFLNYGIVLPSRGSAADPIALWAAHRHADLNARQARADAPGSKLKPPYELIYNDDPKKPAIAIRASRSREQINIRHPQDRKLLVQLALSSVGDRVVSKDNIESTCRDDSRKKAKTADAIVQAVRRNLKDVIDLRLLFKAARNAGCQLHHRVVVKGLEAYKARGRGTNMDMFQRLSAGTNARQHGNMRVKLDDGDGYDLGEEDDDDRDE